VAVVADRSGGRKLDSSRVEVLMKARAFTPSVVVSILFIGLGTLFLLDNIGVLHIWNVWRFWPVVLIVAGVLRLIDRRGPAEWLYSSFMILCGGLWLCNSLNLFHVTFGMLWPLALITLGVTTLAKALESPAVRKNGGRERDLGLNYVREYVIFSGTKKRLETTSFEGGEIVCVFGGVDLNLRKCGIDNAERQVVINVAITFGGVEIKIPEGWRVLNRCVAVFGACEDKTLVPRPEVGVQAPTLVITGQALFGAVNIEN
jgi:hypothetical protein